MRDVTELSTGTVVQRIEFSVLQFLILIEFINPNDSAKIVPDFKYYANKLYLN